MNDPTDLYAHVCAELAIVKAERDELKRDNENMLKTLERLKRFLESTPALLLEVRSALTGG